MFLVHERNIHLFGICKNVHRMKQFQEDYAIIELAKFKVHTIFIFMGYHCDKESLLLRCNIFESVKTALTKKNIMRQVKPEWYVLLTWCSFRE